MGDAESFGIAISSKAGAGKLGCSEGFAPFSAFLIFPGDLS
jgi:hypothetical protein